MRSILKLNKNIIVAILVTILMMSMTTGILYAGIGIVPPKYPQSVLGQETPRAGISISDLDSPELFDPEPDLLKFEYSLDSTLTFYSGKPGISLPFFSRMEVMTFDEYRQQRLENDVRDQWREEAQKMVFVAGAGTGSGALEIEIPWRVRSKTFQRIFGGDRVGLRVTGDITINGKIRKQKSEQTYTTQNDASNYTFQIDQTQRFNIEGKVGDKVSVYIDQDSERMFDFENSLKLEYTGHEDEIIQKIEAGNISLSLTGTKLATFSGNNTGLFGLKTESRFGPFKLTTIASVEKGQKNKLSLSGGAEEQLFEIESKNIVRSKYYFIGEEYRENYRHFNQYMEHVVNSSTGADSIFAIKVYKSTNAQSANAENGYRAGWAMYSPVRENMPDSAAANTDERNNVYAIFQALDENNDYYINKKLGYVRLNYPLSSEQILAVTYITGTDTIGDYILPDSLNENILLKLIRPSNPQPTDSTWNYEFKNVYSLGASGIEQEGFELNIFKDSNTASNDPNTQEVNGQQKTFLEILGLDQRGTEFGSAPDGVMDFNAAFINFGYGEVYLPGLRPFDPDTAKSGEYYIWNIDAGGNVTGIDTVISAIDETTLMPSLYDSTAQYNTVSRYYFAVKYANASASYTLGFNVLEGSEEVYLNGKMLSKGSGYQIDYMTGNLTILDQAASQPAANVEVFWESGEIFQLDKKTLLGVRGEYELWNQESFIGGTALYLNEKPLEERVKLGNEPIRNFILDANTKLVFKPDILTRIIDILPLIEAEQESQISFEGEIARLYPNPNPLNNDATGDKNGVAYVDDFESIKRITSLGVMRKNWSMSSSPPGSGISSYTAIERNFHRGSLIWYNPYNQVAITSIWKDREVSSTVNNEVHVLDMEFDPVEYDTLAPTLDDSWGGVMRYLSAGYADQSKSKFLEIWVNFNEGEACTLHVDLGQLSEDVIPNGILNTEDEFFDNMSFGNGVLDPGEDKGLDMMADDDPAAIAAGGDFWDLNNDGIKDPWELFSNDNYNYSLSNKDNYTNVNGTEGNENDEGTRRPDTEDLDNNNLLDVAENFFRCSIPLPLSTADTLKAADGNGNWKLIRFPLKYAEKYSNASWSLIEYARIWLNGANEHVKVRIATLELVGNEWEEVLTVDPAGFTHEKIEISVINTYDNSSDYEQPPGVRGIRDPISNILAKEQSLVVKIQDLHKDDRAMIQKTFYGSQDFLKYNTLKMFVYADEGLTSVMSDSSMRMFFRFGSDTTQNYYELYQYLDIVPGTGWAPDNQIEIDLTEIPRLKLERTALLIDPGFQTDTKIGYVISEGDTLNTYAYRIVEGDSLVVMGDPSLSQIKQLTIGIDYVGNKRHLSSDDNIQLWLDELRLSDVKKEPGTAYRSSADITLSDLGNMHVEFSEEEAEYYSLNERLDSPGNAKAQSTQVLSGTINVDKIFPPSWGIRIPVNGSYRNDIRTPKFYPNSDIEVDFEDQLAVDTVKTLTKSKGWGVNFTRSGAAGGKILEYTVNKVSCNYNFAETEGSSPSNVYTHSQTKSGQVRYNITIPQEFLSFGFMGWAKNIPILKKMKDSKFQPMLSKVDLQISGSEQNSNSLTRTQYYQASEVFNLTRQFGTGWRPINSINFSLDRQHKSDMIGHEWTEVLDGAFGRENNVTQNFTANYTPTLFSWMTQDFSYTSNYIWSWGSGYAISGKTIQSKNNFSVNATLKTSKIFASKSKKKKPKKPVTPVTPNKEEGDEEGKSKKAKAPNPLLLFPKILGSLNDIRIDYRRSRDLSTPAVTGQAGWKYQFGLSKDPDISRVASYSGASSGSESYTDDYSARSGINITKSIKTTFDYAYKNTESFGNTTNGNYSQSELFLVSKDGSVTALPFANIGARITGLEKSFELFEKYAQTVSVESNYSGKTATDWTTAKSNIIKHTYERNLSPLFGLNITWKGGISTNFSYKRTFTYTDNVSSNQKIRNNNNTIQLTANYNRKSGFKIPIPVWPFKNKRFENNTTFSLVFTASTRKKDEKAGISGSFNEREKNLQWSLKPEISYQFSNTVNGGLHYEMGSTNDKYSGKTSFNEFGFNVRISIRGR